MENLQMKTKYPKEDLIFYINQNNLDDNLSENLSRQNDLQNGRWKQEEHFRFIKGCLLFGNNWKKIKNYVKTRSSAQIRSHAQKYFIKLNKKYHYIRFDDEDNKLKNYNLDYDFVKNVINCDLNNVNMEKIEQMILIIFKNSNSNLNIFSERHNKTINLNENILKNEVLTNSNKKEKIFNFIKIPKYKDYEFDNNENYNNNEFLNKKRNNNMKILYNTNNDLNDFGIEPKKMIQIENFIHNCLDSIDLNDLFKLLSYFDGNLFFQNNYSINQYNPYYYNLKNDNEFYNSFNQSNENYINLNNNINDITSTQNSNEGENQKQFFEYMNYQNSKINELNKNFQNLYSNILNDFYNNYLNINSYPNSIQLNPFLINQLQ